MPIARTRRSRPTSAAISLRRRRGVRLDYLSPPELEDLEPALGERLPSRALLAHGRLHPGPASIAHGSRELCFATVGGRTCERRRSASKHGETRSSRSRRATRELPVESVVLAAGAWSKPLAERLGARVPLDTERGYLAEIEDPSTRPRAANRGGRSTRCHHPQPGRRAARRNGRARWSGRPAEVETHRASRAGSERVPAGDRHDGVTTMDVVPALDAGLAAGDRQVAPIPLRVARLRPRPPRLDACPGDRAPDCRAALRERAEHRSLALLRAALEFAWSNKGQTHRSEPGGRISRYVTRRFRPGRGLTGAKADSPTWGHRAHNPELVGSNPAGYPFSRPPRYKAHRVAMSATTRPDCSLRHPGERCINCQAVWSLSMQSGLVRSPSRNQHRVNSTRGSSRKLERAGRRRSRWLAGETRNSRNWPQRQHTTENRGVGSSILPLAIA